MAGNIHVVFIVLLPGCITEGAYVTAMIPPTRGHFVQKGDTYGVMARYQFRDLLPPGSGGSPINFAFISPKRSEMFKILGAALLCYVAISFATGEVYARDRAWGRTYRREENPWNYWSALVIYSLLAMAMFFLFGRR